MPIYQGEQAKSGDKWEFSLRIQQKIQQRTPVSRQAGCEDTDITVGSLDPISKASVELS